MRTGNGSLLTTITYLRMALVPAVMALILSNHRSAYTYPLAAVLFLLAAFWTADCWLSSDR